MCFDAASLIAAAAVRAAQAEWELCQALNAEMRVHRGVVERARAVLVERGDRLALELFDGVLEREPDLEQARALVESAGAEREERGHD